MTNPNETNENAEATNVNTPLIAATNEPAALEQVVPSTSEEANKQETPVQISIPNNEYRFIQQRIPPKDSHLRFVLPALLLGFQVIFIILFAFFGKYTTDSVTNNVSEQQARKYPSKLKFE